MRVFVLAATLCVASGYARADATKANAATKAAEELAAAGDLIGAAAKYREAYAEDPRIELMCNVGVAYHKAKDLTRAHLFLSRCLERGSALEASFVTTVRAVLNTVEANLKTADFTPVDIVVDPEGARVAVAMFAADESFTGSHLVWMPFGKHRIMLSAEGYDDLELEVIAENRDTLVVKPKLVKKVIHKEVVRENPRSKLPAIGATAFTIAVTAFAIYAYDQAHSRADVATFALSSEVYEADKNFVDKWNTRMLIGAAFAVVGAGASGFLWYRALTPATNVELVPTQTGATLSFRIRY